MTQNSIGKIPEFTSDVPPEETGQGTVPPVEQVVDETPVIEKDTPVAPTETPASNAGENTTPPQSSVQESPEVVGLREERVKLLKEITELRGTKREIKQDQLAIVEKQIDDLKDVNPNDVNLIDRVLRSKGYMTKEEQSKMFYEAVKDEELNKFLDAYPEYKPTNDPNDVNWNALQREIGYYRMPTDPHKIREVLDRAHRAIAKVSSDPSLPQRQRQIQVAGTGGGGTQRSSPSGKTLTPTQRRAYEDGGWSTEEIKQIEANLE